MEFCRIDGCNQPIANKQTKLCHKHQLRFIRFGTTELTRELVDKSKKCKKDGCERNCQTVIGYCLKHYKEWKRQQPADSKQCSVCNKPVGHSGCGGMCAKHYSQWKTYGDALHSDVRQYQPYGTGKRYYKFTDGRWVHRVVAEEILGRKLTAKEVVHHINFNKLDNSPNNLFVCKDNGHHLRVHRQLEHLAAELIDDGIIGFRDGKYYRNI